MAPTDQIRQDFLRRRHESIHELRLRVKERGDGRRDGENNGGKGNGNGNENGNGNGNGNGNNGNNNNSKEGDKNQDSSNQTPTFTTTAAPSSAAATSTIDTTSVIPFITTTPAPPSPTSTTAFASGIPMLTVWPPPLSAATSSEPRKGLNTDSDSSFSSSPSTSIDVGLTSSFVEPTTTGRFPVAASATSGVSSATTGPRFPFPFPASRGNATDHHPVFKGNHRSISPLAEHLLIAFGTIGAFIILATGVFFIMRMRKHSHSSILSFFHNRKFEKGGSRGWYGWRKQETDYTIDPPPQYTAEILEPIFIPAEKERAIYSDAVVASPASETLPKASLFETGREGLLDNAASFGNMPVELPVEPSATENFYNTGTRNVSLNRQVSNVRKNSETQSTMISRQPSDSNYNNTYRTGRTSNAYDPNQREVNHISYLSSLSSGFGDGLIVAEPINAGDLQQDSRQSQSAPARRFSWVPSQPRDTVYTTSSVDTAPRFRTVNSWVAQQSDRVERQRQSEVEIPSMPAVPLILRAGTPAAVQNPASSPTQDSAPAHQRNRSDDPRFNFHPGDYEVEISRGSRVPSSVLDENIGVNELRS